MRRRQSTALAAVAVCLGGALTACGSGGGDGYVAVGAAGSGPDEAPTAAVPPKGRVVLVPLDGATAPGRPAGKPPAEPGKPGGGGASGPGLPGVPGAGSGGVSGGTGAPGGTGGTSGGTGGSGTGTGGGEPGGSGSGGPASPGTPSTPTPSPAPPPATPAVLTLGKPLRTALDKRWCEKVSVEFRNTGGSPATSGTVTFATHIIGPLGIDWATIESTQPLPAPIAPKAVRKQAYTVCVDAWRVPLGMHIDTQDVTAVWK